MNEINKRWKTCRWGHTLDDCFTYKRSRYCRTCKNEREKYNRYLIKCKLCEVVNGIITWNQWAKDKFGGPYERIAVEGYRKCKI